LKSAQDTDPKNPKGDQKCRPQGTFVFSCNDSSLIMMIVNFSKQRNAAILSKDLGRLAFVRQGLFFAPSCDQGMVS
jgi:hypothetical protein